MCGGRCRVRPARAGTAPGPASVWDVAELFRITERAEWLEAVQAGEYRMSTRGVTLEEQGFIHCSLRHQLRGVAEFVYGDVDDLVVLVIDTAKVPAPVRLEASGPAAEEYPHIYGAAAPLMMGEHGGDIGFYRADVDNRAHHAPAAVVHDPLAGRRQGQG